MKAYLAGPMRSLPDFNYPAFHHGTAKLRRKGWTIFSPAEHDVACGLVAEEAAKPENLMKLLADDLRFILTEADALFLLPGWGRSSGSKLEVHAAEFKGIRVVEPEEWWYDEDLSLGHDPGDGMDKELRLRQQEWDTAIGGYR